MVADTSPYFIERGGAGVPAEHLPKPTVALSARDSLLWEGDMPIGAGGRTHGAKRLRLAVYRELARYVVRSSMQCCSMGPGSSKSLGAARKLTARYTCTWYASQH
jgi:hypothetical protein